MPQMSPLNWLMLMILFSITMYLFLSMNYFILNYQPNPTHKTKKTFKNNWKW